MFVLDLILIMKLWKSLKDNFFKIIKLNGQFNFNRISPNMFINILSCFYLCDLPTLAFMLLLIYCYDSESQFCKQPLNGEVVCDSRPYDNNCKVIQQYTYIYKSILLLKIRFKRCFRHFPLVFHSYCGR